MVSVMILEKDYKLTKINVIEYKIRKLIAGIYKVLLTGPSHDFVIWHKNFKYTQD